MDSNDARRILAERALTVLLSLDKLYRAISSVLYGRISLRNTLQSAILKSSRDLTVGEQSCITKFFPSRLPHIEVGISTLYPLQNSLFEAIMSLANSVKDDEIAEESSVGIPFLRSYYPLSDRLLQTSSLAASLATFVYELQYLAEQPSLDYATYQTVVGWLQDLVGSKDGQQRYLKNLKIAIDEAKISLKLTSGKHLAAIWRHFLPNSPSNATLAEVVTQMHVSAAQCDTARTPEGKSTLKIAGVLLIAIRADLERLYAEVASIAGKHEGDADCHSLCSVAAGVTQVSACLEKF